MITVLKKDQRKIEKLLKDKKQQSQMSLEDIGQQTLQKKSPRALPTQSENMHYDHMF